MTPLRGRNSTQYCLLPTITILVLITSTTSAHYVDEDDYALVMERVRQRQQLEWQEPEGQYNQTSSPTTISRQKRSMSFAELDSLDNYDSEGNCILSNDTLAKVNIW